MTKNDRENHFQVFAEKMQAENLPDIAISNFEHHYLQLRDGQSGLIPESEISPVKNIQHADELNERHAELGDHALSETVLLKLNGGLGTSMGLEKAKSLINVKRQFSFLDVIAQHAIFSRVHLLLMNSFSTREDSRQALDKYPSLSSGNLDIDFLQHKVPKIDADTLLPAAYPDNSQLEWCPPGHGDIYIALVSSGILDRLLEAGYRYALVSNSDNLGAVLDTSILGYFAEHQYPFLMEVTNRTEADKKGGHLALGKDGKLLLRESAQCAENDKATFEDIERHRFFNTNNLWIDLQQLKMTLVTNNNILNLPLIRNTKPVNPRDNSSPQVYQLETAMGSAISVFEGARAICVPRTRFAPVKTTNDLLLVRSDIYELKENYTLSSHLPYSELPTIDLDNRYFKLIDDFEKHFPAGPPSMKDCKSLEVKGDIVFSENIQIRGRVSLLNKSRNAVILPAGTEISENMVWD